MKTFYIIMTIGHAFIATGSGCHLTSSLNYAKHFTSIWSAEQFMKRNELPEDFYFIKKICHQ